MSKVITASNIVGFIILFTITFHFRPFRLIYNRVKSEQNLYTFALQRRFKNDDRIEKKITKT